MTNTVDWNLPDTWGELGKDWWLENGRLAGCTEEQIKFAVLRHGGANAVSAAKGAGYAHTNSNALRQAAYRAARSAGVMNALALAAAADGLGEGAISDAEVDAKIAKLVRSPDARVSIAAIEAREKQKARRQASEPERLPGSPDEVILEMLREFGGALFIPCGLLFEMGNGDLGWGLASTPLLAPHCKTKYPDLWAKKRSELGGQTKAFDELGNGPLLSVEQIIAQLAAHVGR